MWSLSKPDLDSDFEIDCKFAGNVLCIYFTNDVLIMVDTFKNGSFFTILYSLKYFENELVTNLYDTGQSHSIISCINMFSLKPIHYD